MKKLWIILLVLCMLPTAVLAEVQLSGPNEFPIVNEKIDLSAWVVQPVDVEDYETNATTLWYEDKTNIHINWIPINFNEEGTKKSLSLASGDYPDMYLCGFSTSDLWTYGTTGTFLPLNDLIENYGYHAKQRLEQFGYVREAITAPDGNIYSLFQLWEEPNETILNKLFVFMPWLEKAGLEMPATLEEFQAMLVYFRDHDMNGNGDATDEIPLLGTYQYASQGSDPMYAIMETFQRFPGNFITADAAGKITFLANTNEFRDGLRFVNKLYEEKLLAEETYIQDLTQYRAIVNVSTPEDMVVGVAAAPYYLRFVTQSIYARAYEDFKPIPPFQGYYDGVRHATQANPPYGPRITITSACKHPEAAMKWLDWWLSEEGSMRTTKYGEEGIDYQWTDAFPSIAGETPSILMLGAENKNRLWHTWNVPNLVDRAMFEKTAVDPHATGRLYPDYTAHMVYEPYAVPQGIPPIAWCSDEDLITEHAELESLISDYVKTSYTKFIIGTVDIEDDNAWNAYLAELDAMGLADYIAMAETYYFGNK